VPAAAVIPAPIAYIKVAAVKKLVVGFLVESCGGVVLLCLHLVCGRGRGFVLHLSTMPCGGGRSVARASSLIGCGHVALSTRSNPPHRLL
jgi:hypothetical protein